MAACELVIFDCDGTLMDSEVLAANLEIEMMKEYGIELTAAEFNHRFAGTSSRHVQKVMEEESGRFFPEDHLKKLDMRMNEKLWREVEAVNGAHEMLDLLDQPRCICSNSKMEKLKIELSRAELWDRFRPYVFSSLDLEGVAPKPEPDIFLHAAKEFNVAPKVCTVVEDSVPGIIAAKAAGMRVIGFVGASHTYAGHADRLTEAGAETVVRRLVEIPAVVEAFGLWEEFD